VFSVARLDYFWLITADRHDLDAALVEFGAEFFPSP
jgi:hypothetical protein